MIDKKELNEELLGREKFKDVFDSHHEKRVVKIKSAGFLPKTEQTPFLIFSAYPVCKVQPIDLTDKVLLNKLKEFMQPPFANAWDYRHNFEGYFVFEGDKNGIDKSKITSFCQLHRNANLEVYTKRFFYDNPNSGSKVLLGQHFEDVIDECFKIGLNIYEYLSIDIQMYIKVSILGLNNTYIISEPGRSRVGGLIDRKSLNLPGMLVEKSNIEEMKLHLKDIVWQAGGVSQSLSRSEQKSIH